MVGLDRKENKTRKKIVVDQTEKKQYMKGIVNTIIQGIE